VLACKNPRFDIERFGAKVVDSARHADIFLVVGPVTKQAKKRLELIFSQIEKPKKVIAVGACAISGGIFRTAPSTAAPLDGIIPVDMYVPGCPPKPEAIIDAILKVLKDD
jgi:ech hydrogenase subunit C